MRNVSLAIFRVNFCYVFIFLFSNSIFPDAETGKLGRFGALAKLRVSWMADFFKSIGCIWLFLRYMSCLRSTSPMSYAISVQFLSFFLFFVYFIIYILSCMEYHWGRVSLNNLKHLPQWGWGRVDHLIRAYQLAPTICNLTWALTVILISLLAGCALMCWHNAQLFLKPTKLATPSFLLGAGTVVKHLLSWSAYSG